MKHLVIGLGEVGTAIQKVFKCDGWDALQTDRPKLNEQYDYLHICISYSEDFIGAVLFYQQHYEPKYTIIHSTVPIGTSRQLNAIHSPIRGLHPNLYDGIMTFPKFVGGPKASLVANEFRRHGLKVYLCDKQEDTEAMKIFDTEYYRVCIEFMHRVKSYCNANGLNFSDVYRMANITYNEGYEKLGYPEYIRPVLEPIMGEIGGHCVVPNSKLI